MSSEKTIDYLFEDPEISSQKYALVSIVGPHMKQKCDVWGLKIRGVSDTLEKAKSTCQRLLRIDNNYDIYTVEVGKFFPLAVEPHQIENIEYENKQLNTLIKSYLENKENANELWHKRKNEMIEDAIKEGKNQKEFASKPEHPIAVLHRIKDYSTSIEEITGHLNALQEKLQDAKTKFETYNEDERIDAETKFNNELITSKNKTDIKVDEITQERPEEKVNVEDIISKLQMNEKELEEMTSFQSSISESAAPSAYKRISKNITDLEKEIVNLKTILNDNQLVNSYINSNYTETKYKFD